MVLLLYYIVVEDSLYWMERHEYRQTQVTSNALTSFSAMVEFSTVANFVLLSYFFRLLDAIWFTFML